MEPTKFPVLWPWFLPFLLRGSSPQGEGRLLVGVLAVPHHQWHNYAEQIPQDRKHSAIRYFCFDPLHNTLSVHLLELSGNSFVFYS